MRISVGTAPLRYRHLIPTGAKLTADQRGLLRDEDRYNQLGGSIGGPIWKNRVFAFFAYEGQSQSVPRPARNGFRPLLLRPWRRQTASPPLTSTSREQQWLGTVIASATCADAGLTEGVNCRPSPGQGLNIGSPLTTGLGTQDLTYVNNSTPGVGSGLSNVPDITQYSIRTRPAAISNSTADVSTPT